MAQTFVYANKVTGNSEAISVLSDDLGYTLTTGRFSGTSVDFDPGPAYSGFSSSGGSDDVFVMLKNPTGGLVWVKRIGDQMTEQPIKMVTVGTNIFIIGTFTGTVDFDPGTGVSNLSTTSSIIPEYFLLNLNTSGDFVSARKIVYQVLDLETDVSGNLFLSGLSSNSLARITKYNSNLDVLWSVVLGNFPNSAAAEAINVDNQGNVYSMGSFSGTCDFDPGAGVSNLTVPSPKYGKFISKLNSSGQFVWAKSIIYSGSLSITDLIADDSGRVFMSGNFSGTIDFDPGAGVNNLSSNTPNFSDGFIMSILSNGNFNWAFGFGGSNNDYANACTLDKFGKLYVCGNFAGSAVDFDPGPGTAILSSSLYLSSYILKIHPGGQFISVGGIFGDKSNSMNAIHIDNSQNIYAVGGFSDSTDFDPGSGSSYLWGYAFYRSSYLAKYSQCIVPQAAGPITGPSLICTDQTYTFSVAPVSGADNYIWDIPQDAAIISGANTRTIQVKFGPNEISSSVFVRGTNSCGTGILSVKNVFVKQSPDISVSISPNDSVCTGSQVSLFATGANSYTWDNGIANGVDFTPAQTQMYSVIGQATNGCSATKSVTVTLMPKPVLSVDVQPAAVVCSGTIVTMTASGASNYDWTGGITNGIAFTPTSSQDYIASGFSSFGCQAQNVIIPITVNYPPTIINHPVSQTVLEGANVVMTATFQNPGVLLYQWQLDGGAGFTNISNLPPFSNATTTSLSIAQAPFTLNETAFRCIATAAGCSSTTNQAILQVTPVAVENFVEGNRVGIYPVPAQDHIRIKGLEEGKHTVRLFTVSGLEIRQFQVQKSQREDPLMELGSLPTGFYYLEVENRKFRLVKNEGN